MNRLLLDSPRWPLSLNLSRRFFPVRRSRSQKLSPRTKYWRARPPTPAKKEIMSPVTRTISSINLTFLGTASAQPSSTRNHSALALRLDRDIWLFDCGEATQHQLQKSDLKMGKISKIFITHTHGDHIFGILPLLASRLNGAGGMVEGVDDPRMEGSVDQEPLEIYGPLGTRAYIRGGLMYSHTFFGAPYVVHELRTSEDPQEGDYISLPLHSSESPRGKNIRQVNGVWADIYKDDFVSVSAAPILHSVPCLGFVLTEAPVPGKMDPKLYVPELKRTNTPMEAMRRLQKGESVTLSDGTILEGPARKPGRKIAILGDTYDPSPIAQLATDVDLLVHESTNAHLPGIEGGLAKEDETYEIVEARAKSRGHSTPQLAGAFAKRVGAKKLVLNHFSARYAGNDDVDEGSKRVMDAIRFLASTEFDGPIVCARDFMSIDVLHRK